MRACFGDRRLEMLDAGCQAGRLLIPLALDGHRIQGIDTSGFALRRAAQHARSNRVRIQLRRGNLSRLERWIKPGSLDVLVCAEVLYLCAAYRDLLRLLATSVRPGGLLCVSHRPTLYYVATAVRGGRPEQAASLIRRSEGPSTDGAYHNWQTAEQLAELYRGLHLDVLGRYEIAASDVRLDLSTVTDGPVRELLESVHHTDSLYRIPTYQLIIART